MERQTVDRHNILTMPRVFCIFIMYYYTPFNPVWYLFKKVYVVPTQDTKFIYVIFVPFNIIGEIVKFILNLFKK